MNFVTVGGAVRDRHRTAYIHLLSAHYLWNQVLFVEAPLSSTLVRELDVLLLRSLDMPLKMPVLL